MHYFRILTMFALLIKPRYYIQYSVSLGVTIAAKIFKDKQKREIIIRVFFSYFLRVKISV